MPDENVDAVVEIELAARARMWPFRYGNVHVAIDATSVISFGVPVGCSYVPWTTELVPLTVATTGDERAISITEQL